MKNILVSACLLGVSCRYDGKSCPDDNVIRLKDKYNLIPICPEIMGGLPTPRLPCEIENGKVLRSDNLDVTKQYIKGANEALRLANMFGCDTAILKERSPSCGYGIIHDGSFSGALRVGNGKTAELLEKNGIKIIGESKAEILL